MNIPLGITSTLPVWLICVYLALMGIGLGTSMQILVLIVQNQFPNSQVGMVTASNNYFRQIGASLGSAVVGSLFAHRLADILTERLAGILLLFVKDIPRATSIDRGPEQPEVGQAGPAQPGR